MVDVHVMVNPGAMVAAAVAARNCLNDFHSNSCVNDLLVDHDG